MVGSMSKYFVIAGNRNEYMNFIVPMSEKLWKEGQTSISFSHFVYVDSIDRIRGVRDIHGWFVGSWRERKDILEILQYMMVINHNNKIIADEYSKLFKRK